MPENLSPIAWVTSFYLPGRGPGGGPPDLWVVLLCPDPTPIRSIPAAGIPGMWGLHPARTVMGSGTIAVELDAQNELREKLGLAPLPHPRDVPTPGRAPGGWCRRRGTQGERRIDPAHRAVHAFRGLRSPARRRGAAPLTPFART